MTVGMLRLYWLCIRQLNLYWVELYQLYTLWELKDLIIENIFSRSFSEVPAKQYTGCFLSGWN